jgi:NitT/TauT family transport system permease protein
MDTAAKNFLWSRLAPVTAIILCFVVWQMLAVGLHVREVILPSPAQILQALTDSPGYFLQEGAYTLMTTLQGFAIAAVAGVVLAVVIVEVPLLDSTVYALIIALNSVPKVAVAPLFVIWLGTGSAPKIAIASLIACFAIVIDTVLGLKSVPKEMLELAHTMRGGRFDVFWRIRLPCALPSMFAGLKVGISLALVGAIVGEFVASDHGLGYVILTAQGTFDTPQIFAANLLLALIGVVLFGLLTLLERRLIPWHASHRA